MNDITELRKIIDEAYYAMVGGNIAREPISVDIVDSWFDLIYKELKKGEETK